MSHKLWVISYESWAMIHDLWVIIYDPYKCSKNLFVKNVKKSEKNRNPSRSHIKLMYYLVSRRISSQNSSIFERENP